MLETMSRKIPGLGWLLPIPFYFMELLVGFVQALVFMLLCAVFTLLMCQHEEEDLRAPMSKDFSWVEHIQPRWPRRKEGGTI